METAQSSVLVTVLVTVLVSSMAVLAAGTEDPSLHQIIVDLPLANGFVHLSFHPEELHVPLGESRVGYVNVSIDEHALHYLPLRIHQCCEDPSIATVSADTLQRFVVRNQSTVLRVEARGTQLGQTSLKFYVARNDTDQKRRGFVAHTVAASDGSQYQDLGRDRTGVGARSPLDSDTASAGLGRDASDEQEATDLSRPAKLRYYGGERNAANSSSNSSRSRNTSKSTEYPKVDLRRASASSSSSSSRPVENRAAEQPNFESAIHVRIQQQQLIKANMASYQATPIPDPVWKYQVPGQDLSDPPDGQVQWWITTEYPVLVSSPTNRAGPYLHYTVMVLVALNLFGVGGQIDGDEAVELLKKPLSVTIGFFCRFAVIPAVSLLKRL